MCLCLSVRSGVLICTEKKCFTSLRTLLFRFSRTGSCISTACCSTANEASQDSRLNETVEKSYEVYSGALSMQIKTLKYFSFGSSICGLVAQPMIIEKSTELGMKLPLLIFTLSFVGFFTFITPVLLHLIARKYVTSIYYTPKSDVYTANLYSFLLRNRKISFKPDEAKVPEIPGIFTTVVVRGTPLFINGLHFDDIEHYKRIMGYDKPMDFKLGPDEKEK